MKRELVEILMHLALVSPILIFSLKDKKRESYVIALIFSIFVIVNKMLLNLPFEYKNVAFLNENWNWAGKIYAMLGSLVFIVIYRKFELKDYFLTFKQNREFLKAGFITIVVILSIQIFLVLMFDTLKKWDLETILFQLTMPSFEEEIAYRGIMLGLLVKILKPKFKIFSFNIGNPAILITALLFGFAHGLYFSNTFELNVNLFALIRTTILGIVWGWMTIRSGSILFALISHNLGNVIGTLIKMR